MRSRVRSQCGARIARQSTSSLPKKRYAATVSPHPRHAIGMLAVGLADNRSISTFARLFSRSSPSAIPENSSATQLFVANRSPKLQE